MTLSQLELLVALVETGSFAQAAERLDLTQSAVSHSLAKLEHELGLTLVERGKRGVVLTGAGQETLLHAREVQASVEAIRQAATAARGLAAGRVRFGTTYPLSARLLVGIVSAFHRQHPQVELVLFEGTGDEVEGWLRESVVDAGIVLHPTPDIDSELLADDEIVAVFGAQHRFRQKATLTVEELQRERLILPRLGFKQITRFLQDGSGERARLASGYSVSDTRTLYLMARENLGVALMPRTTLPDERDGLFTASLSPAFPFPVGIGVRARETAPAAKLLLQTASAWAIANNYR